MEILYISNFNYFILFLFSYPSERKKSDAAKSPTGPDYKKH